MGEIVNGQIGGKGRPNNCITGDIFIAEIAKALSVSRPTVTRYQLAARLNEQANFDAHLADYRDDEVGRNLALMTFLADIRRLLRRVRCYFIYRGSRHTQHMWQIALTTNPPTHSAVLSAKGSTYPETKIAATTGIPAKIEL